MKLKKLCISCGGTGGHFYPGLAVGREFREQGGEVLLLLGGKHADAQMQTAASFGIPARKIQARPRSFRPAGLFRFLSATLKGTFQCRKIYREFHPDALLAMGSFASFPPILGAKLARVPLFLHDGNARLGQTNLKMGPWADGLALSFPSDDAAKCGCPCIHTGMPLRPELVRGQLSRAEAIAEINRRWQAGFTVERPTVLIFGGSLGAASINLHCRVTAEDFGADSLQLIHLTGKDKFDELKRYYRDAGFPCLLLESSPDMHLFYSAADWIVCRAGGSTVAELACFGKSALLIPYPFAAQDHQTDNARYLTSSGGAQLLPDGELTRERFTAELKAFLAAPDRFREKGRKLKALAFPDAAARVIKMIDGLLTVPR